MFFNEKKFECLSISKLERVPHFSTQNGLPIANKLTVKDLGITLQTDLSFSNHISTIASKGIRLAGWVDRSFKFRTTHLMRTLLKQLVVPQVEYCCVIWNPRTQQHTNLLESVERRFTKKFPCFWQYNGDAERYECTRSYKDRLKDLKLLSLKRRRQRYLIIMLFKIAIEYVVNPGLVLEVDQRGRWRFHRKFTTDNNIQA